MRNGPAALAAAAARGRLGAVVVFVAVAHVLVVVDAATRCEVAEV